MATAKLLIGDPDRNVAIEQMTEHDLLAVVEIEEASGLSPWGWDAYHKELQSPEDVIMLVARADSAGGPVAGFIVSRLIGPELHVYNMAVRPELRRRGVAARLLRAVLEWGRLKGAGLLSLAVVACPCHLPILLAVLGGTTIGRSSRPMCCPSLWCSAQSLRAL